MTVRRPKPRLLALVRMKSEIVHCLLKASRVHKRHAFPKVKLAPAKYQLINVPEIQRKDRVLGLSLLPVEMMSRQKLQDPLAERMETEHVPHQKKLKPVQKGRIFLKAKMAPMEDLLIKVLAILTKGLALGLSLFPIMIGSCRKLQDQRHLAV